MSSEISVSLSKKNHLESTRKFSWTQDPDKGAQIASAAKRGIDKAVQNLYALPLADGSEQGSWEKIDSATKKRAENLVNQINNLMNFFNVLTKEVPDNVKRFVQSQQAQSHRIFLQALIQSKLLRSLWKNQEESLITSESVSSLGQLVEVS